MNTICHKNTQSKNKERFIFFRILTLFHGVFVSCVIYHLYIVAGCPVCCVAVASYGTAAVSLIVAGNPGHPSSPVYASACSFPNPSSFVEPVAGESAACSKCDRSIGPACSYFSSPGVFLYKRMARFDSGSNLNYGYANDTSVLPRAATTNHCKRRCPLKH